MADLAETIPDDLSPRVAPTATWADRSELLWVVGMVLVAFPVQLWFGRDLWFSNDFWALLLEHDLSFKGLIEPHSGHWAVFHIITTQVLYRLVGLDYWPWYDVVRAAAWIALSVWMWRLVRLRGANELYARGMLAVLLVYGSIGWTRGWFIGNFMAVGLGLAVAYTIAQTPRPSLRRIAGVAGLLLLLVIATGVGVAAMLSVVFCVVAFRECRRYWPSALAALTVYVVWYLRFRSGGPQASPDLSLATLLQLPIWYVEALATGMRRLIGNVGSPWLGWPIAVAVLSFFGWMVVKGRFGIFERIVFFWASGFMALAGISRIAAGQAVPGAERYAYLTTLLTLAIVVPHLAAPRRAMSKAALALVVVALIVANVSLSLVSFRFWSNYSDRSRSAVDVAASLIADGEPYLDKALVDRTTGILNAAGLARVVRGGYAPSTPVGADIETARGALRIRTQPANMLPALTFCSPVRQAASVTYNSVELLFVILEERDTAQVSHADGRGAGTILVRDRSGIIRVELAPGTDVVVSITSQSGNFIVCEP